MFSKIPKPNTLAFQFTAWYSAVFIASSLLLFGLAYLLVNTSLRERDRAGILTALNEYAARYADDGTEAFSEHPDRSSAGAGRFFVRVTESDNTTVFLNDPERWVRLDLRKLHAQPAPDQVDWVDLPLIDSHNWEIASKRLTGGRILQVGAGTEQREDVLEQFVGVFAAVMLPVILVGLAGGSLFAVRALRPIRHLIQTVRAITETGRLDARVPMEGAWGELHDLARLVNQMLDRIARLITGMRDALDNVAHDLRTPIARLRGRAEDALQSNPDPVVSQEALTSCLEESEEILTMLNTLMDISEAETGTLALDRRSIDLTDVLANVVDLYRDVTDEKHLLVVLSPSKDLRVNADPNRMRQVLGNLLDNAVKYTPSGGRIDIEGYRNGQQAVVTVRDTGSGISPEDLPKIWDRLYRGDKSRSQRGLGLGLSLVKAIVHAHGGSVDVASSPGSGSCFTVTLPLGSGLAR